MDTEKQIQIIKKRFFYIYSLFWQGLNYTTDIFLLVNLLDIFIKYVFVSGSKTLASAVHCILWEKNMYSICCTNSFKRKIIDKGIHLHGHA